MKTYRYQAFGLTIQSDMELPMLLPAKKYARSQVNIRKGRISSSGLKSPVIKHLHYQSAPGQLWLKIPAIGRFLIKNGNEIRYQPDPKTDVFTVRLFLLGTCMGALLQQRELIVLHAMAVRHGDDAIVFASASGEGKTTLAAVMHKQGYEILTDDLCVIDDNNLVQPGYPVLKLWRDCFRVMQIKPGTINRIRPGVEKYAYRMNEGFCNTPLPIKSVYILHSWNQDDPEMNAITGMQKLMPLQSNTYRLQYLEGQGLMKKNMGKLMKLAGKIDLKIVTRPQHDYKVSQLIDFIESDIKKGNKEKKNA